MADDVDELHRFAHRLGLQLSSYQGPPKTRAPHYDITGIERDRAVRLGAVPVGRKEIVELVRKLRVTRAEMEAAGPVQTPKLQTKRPG